MQAFLFIHAEHASLAGADVSADGGATYCLDGVLHPDALSARRRLTPDVVTLLRRLMQCLCCCCFFVQSHWKNAHQMVAYIGCARFPALPCPLLSVLAFLGHQLFWLIVWCCRWLLRISPEEYVVEQLQLVEAEIREDKNER